MFRWNDFFLLKGECCLNEINLDVLKNMNSFLKKRLMKLLREGIIFLFFFNYVFRD